MGGPGRSWGQTSPPQYRALSSPRPSPLHATWLPEPGNGSFCGGPILTNPGTAESPVIDQRSTPACPKVSSAPDGSNRTPVLPVKGRNVSGLPVATSQRPTPSVIDRKSVG